MKDIIKKLRYPGMAMMAIILVAVNIGCNKFLDTQTVPARDSRPVPYSTLPAGVSNIYVSRVSFGTMGRGLSFDAL